MKKHEFASYSIANFGGLSIDTVTESDIDKTLYFLDSMKKTDLKGFYSINLLHGIDFGACDMFGIYPS